MKRSKDNWIETLLPQNAHRVATVINKNHPEWGIKQFQYRAQLLVEGRVAHIVGSGCNGKVLFEEDMHRWGVVSFKD